MNHSLVLLAVLPVMVAAGQSNRQAVGNVLDKMIAGETLPPEILDRQGGSPEFPDLDKAIADVRGCKVAALDSLETGNYGVQWRCQGRRQKDQPSAMIVYVVKGQVTRITTAVLSGAM